MALADKAGFALLPGIESLRVSAGGIAPYSLPQEALSFQPDEGIVFHCFSGGDKERKLHCNVELSGPEMDRLRSLQEETRAQGLSFDPTVASMATRFLDNARGDVQLAAAAMAKIQQWRKEYYKQPLTESRVAEFIRLGIVYWTGRDKCLRPTLVFRARRIPVFLDSRRNASIKSSRVFPPLHGYPWARRGHEYYYQP